MEPQLIGNTALQTPFNGVGGQTSSMSVNTPLDTQQVVIHDCIKELIQTIPVNTVPKLVLDDAAVPLIDLQEIYQATGERRAELIQIFGDALKNVGFIAIKAEELQELIEKVYEEMRGYFSQSFEVKMQDWRENSEVGFSQNGRETAAGATQADLKETFFVPPNFTDWPKGRDKFPEVMEAYRKECEKIIETLMQFIAEYLDEPTEEVCMSTGSEYNLLRLAYYPPPGTSTAPSAGPHEDLNGLTILAPATTPGLQLLNKQGVWQKVNIPKGYLIINTGEQIQMKTGGLIKATRHQVLNPGGEYANQERYAIPFFGTWSEKFCLYPFQSCIDKMTATMTPEEKEVYMKNLHGKETTVKDNLMSRLIELRTIRDPSKELLRDLVEKNLLKLCPEEIKEQNPEIFGR